MNRNLFLSTATLALIAGSAFAADLPSRQAPPVYVAPVPVFSWTGFYIGAQAGYAFGRDISSDAAFFGGTNTINPRGFIAGGHIGYNFAPAFGGLVFGVEGDVDGSNYNRTFIFNNGAGYNTSSTIQGSARGRVGFAVDRALFYATGGAAFAGFKNTYSTGDRLSTTRVGYTVGGGVEYAISSTWSLRGEYRYSDFGTYSDALAVAGTFSHHETENRAQVGVSYKFDTLIAPVVARY